MNLYDKIKNPLYDDETIKALLEMYAKHGRISYNDIVTYGENGQINKKEQNEEFEENILVDCIKHEVDSLLKTKITEEELLNYTQKRNKKIEEFDEKISDIDKNNEEHKAGYEKCEAVINEIGIIPLVNFREILNTNTRLAKALKDNNVTQSDLIDYEKYELTKYNDECNKKADFIKEHPDYSSFFTLSKKYTAEELVTIENGKKNVPEEEQKSVEEFLEFIENKHNFFEDRVMGYHVYKRNFEEVDMSKEMDEAKLYINADYNQVYKIANLFWKKAEEKGIDYNFKVNYPKIDEENRADKFVIFSTLDNLNTNVEILDEIKQEHPEFVFKNPGLLVGKLDNNIGVGMDPKKGSYNIKRAKFINEAFNEYFDGLNSTEVQEVIKSDKGIITKIKTQIKQKLLKSDISDKKFCIDKEKEEEFKRATSDKNADKKSSETKNSKEKPDKLSDTIREKQNKPSGTSKEEQNKSSKKGEEEQNKSSEKNKERQNELDEDNKIKRNKATENSPKEQNEPVKSDKTKEDIQSKEKESKEPEKDMKENLKELKKLMKDYVQVGKESFANNEKRKESSAINEKIRKLISTLYKQKAEKLNIKETLLERRMNERRLDAIVSNVIRSAQTLKQQENFPEGIAQKDLELFNFSMNELNKYFSEENYKEEKKDKSGSKDKSDSRDKSDR